MMPGQTMLLNELKNSNTHAFDSLFKEYYEMLVYVGLQYVSNKEDAKEAVQEAFVKLWENRKEIRPDANIKNFLYTIVKNNCLNILKKNEVVVKSKEHILWREMQYRYLALNETQYEDLEFEELKTKINDAIEALPKQCQKVFKLSRYEDLKYKEIAVHLNISEKTVETHMTKALKLLKEELKEYLPLILAITNMFD